MINCPNCGTQNAPQSKFCIKCGNALNNINQQQSTSTEVNQTVSNVQPNIPNIGVDNNIQNNQNINTNNTVSNVQTGTSQTSNTSAGNLNFIMYIIAILLKPFKCFNEEESKLSNAKNSVILTLVVTIIMTLVTLIQTIITTVRVSSFSFSTGTTKSWDFSRMKDINYIQVIGKNFLIYACVILAITIVFYIGSLIIKKQLNFVKTLGISATSVIPAVVGSMILSPILGSIWAPLGIVFTIVGAIYSILILFELMNKELQLEGDVKIYFNLVCFSILAIALYYAYMKLFMSSMGDLTNNLNDLLDYFK